MARAGWLSQAVVLLALASAGCHESDIEPQMPIPDDWTEWQEPVEATMSQEDIPPMSADNPAPLPDAPPRSISLGYIGNEPLTQPEVPARWPWRQEPFVIDKYPYAVDGPRARAYRYGY